MQYEFFDGDFKVPHSNKTSNSDFKEWCPTYWNDVLDSGGYLICPTNLMFHSDWNWLMEVVEKIESKGFDVHINTCVCRISDVGEDRFEDIETFNSNSKLQAVYQAVLEFINTKII